MIELNLKQIHKYMSTQPERPQIKLWELKWQVFQRFENPTTSTIIKNTKKIHENINVDEINVGRGQECNKREWLNLEDKNSWYWWHNQETQQK